MENLSTYWLPTEIRQELGLPVAPETHELYTTYTGDSMAMYGMNNSYNVVDLMNEYFHPAPQADYATEPQPIVSLTEANLQAYQAHLQSQAAQAPSFLDFKARCPTAGQEYGMNPPCEFKWEVCSSNLTESEEEEVRPVTPYMNDGALHWDVAESDLTFFDADNGNKRMRDCYADYENKANKRFCNSEHVAVPVAQRTIIDELDQLFPFGWELPQHQCSQWSDQDVSTFRLPSNAQAYWNNWQPEPDCNFYHFAEVDFSSLPDYEDMVVPEPEREISPAHAWLQEHIMLPPRLFEPNYEEQQHFALTPMVEDAPVTLSPLPMTPVIEQPTPPWRSHVAFADTEEGERVRQAIPLPPTRFLRMQAQDLLHKFEEHPIPDIADILPLKQRIRPAQEDILNWKFFSKGLPLAQRRNRQVPHLTLFWNSKATHDVHPQFYDTQVVRSYR